MQLLLDGSRLADWLRWAKAKGLSKDSLLTYMHEVRRVLQALLAVRPLKGAAGAAGAALASQLEAVEQQVRAHLPATKPSKSVESQQVLSALSLLYSKGDALLAEATTAMQWVRSYGRPNLGAATTLEKAVVGLLLSPIYNAPGRAEALSSSKLQPNKCEWPGCTRQQGLYPCTGNYLGATSMGPGQPKSYTITMPHHKGASINRGGQVQPMFLSLDSRLSPLMEAWESWGHPLVQAHMQQGPPTQHLITWKGQPIDIKQVAAVWREAMGLEEAGNELLANIRGLRKLWFSGLVAQAMLEGRELSQEELEDAAAGMGNGIKALVKHYNSLKGELKAHLSKRGAKLATSLREAVMGMGQ